MGRPRRRVQIPMKTIKPTIPHIITNKVIKGCWDCDGFDAFDIWYDVRGVLDHINDVLWEGLRDDNENYQTT